MLTKKQLLPGQLAVVFILAGWHTVPGAAQQAPPSQPDRATLQKWVKMLGSDEFKEREEASGRLVTAGEPALPHLGAATRSSDPEVRQRAEKCIKSIERNQAVGRLILQLRANTPKERKKAMEDLLQFREAAAIIVPALIRAMDDQDLDVRLQAMGELSVFGPAGKPAVFRLIAIAEDTNLSAETRSRALLCLRGFRDLARDTIPALLKLVKSKEFEIADDAIIAIGKVARGDDRAVPVLLELLKHENVQIRGRAAGCLGSIGRQPAVIVPALIELFRKETKAKKGQYDPRYFIIGGIGCFQF